MRKDQITKELRTVAEDLEGLWDNGTPEVCRFCGTPMAVLQDKYCTRTRAIRNGSYDRACPSCGRRQDGSEPDQCKAKSKPKKKEPELFTLMTGGNNGRNPEYEYWAIPLVRGSGRGGGCVGCFEDFESAVAYLNKHHSDCYLCGIYRSGENRKAQFKAAGGIPIEDVRASDELFFMKQNVLSDAGALCESDTNLRFRKRFGPDERTIGQTETTGHGAPGNTNTEDRDMFDASMNKVGKKLVDRFFRRVDDVVWDLMSGRVGIRTRDGIATLEGEGTNAQITVNLFDDFGVALPAFAQNTPVDQIKVGDLIYGDRGARGWVIKTPTPKGKAFKLLKPGGESGTWTPPKVNSLGLDLSGAMVLRSLVNTLPEGGLGNMQSMLLPMLAMGDGDMDLEGMLPMLLMSQCGMGGMAAPADGNPMGNMLQSMMMMKMMGGAFGGGGDREGKPGFFDGRR